MGKANFTQDKKKSNGYVSNNFTSNDKDTNRQNSSSENIYDSYIS